MFVPVSFIKKYFRTIIVLILIFYLGTVSGEKVSRVTWITIPNIDKIVHLLMYLILSITLTCDIVRNKQKIAIQKTLILIVLFAITYGGAIELLQHFFIKTRTGDWIDFCFNVIGASLGIPFFLIYKRNVNRQYLK